MVQEMVKRNETVFTGKAPLNQTSDVLGLRKLDTVIWGMAVTKRKKSEIAENHIYSDLSQDRHFVLETFGVISG